MALMPADVSAIAVPPSQSLQCLPPAPLHNVTVCASVSLEASFGTVPSPFS